MAKIETLVFPTSTHSYLMNGGGIFSGTIPRCVNKIMAQCGSDGSVHGFVNLDGTEINGTPWRDPNFATDDCVVGTLLGQGRGAKGGGHYQQARYWFNGFQPVVLRNELAQAGYSGTSFVDENCNVLSSLDGTRMCGAFRGRHIMNTPISLLMDDNYDIDAGATVTQFPLSLSQSEKWYLWKASDKSPLLVWDPGEKGIIKDARQLFGSETFGKHWKDGYEALSTFDKNNDGKVSGRELDSLSLWFDSNKNGVSETGEVRSISNAGIVALFYKPDRDTGATLERTSLFGDLLPKSRHDLYATKGFQRLVKGKITTGSSVDWGSRGYSVRPSLDTPSSPDMRQNVSGAWEWKLDGFPSLEIRGLEAQGAFTIKDLNARVLTGHSYGESTLSEGGKEGRSVIIRPFEGSKDQADDGSIKVAFIVYNTEDESSRTESKAVLSSDGKTLHGESSLITSDKGEILRYTWTANRQLRVGQ